MTNTDRLAQVICKACEENPMHRGDAGGNEYRWQDYLPIASAALVSLAPAAVEGDAEGEFETFLKTLPLGAQQNVCEAMDRSESVTFDAFKFGRELAAAQLAASERTCAELREQLDYAGKLMDTAIANYAQADDECKVLRARAEAAERTVEAK
jgi:hypothetical protein